MRLHLTRNQLAQFLTDHEQIKQFEKLFGLNEEYLNSGMIDGIAMEAGNADAKGNQALALIERLQDLIDAAASEPPVERTPGAFLDYIDFPVDGPHVTLPRRMQWNEDDGTIDVGLNADVTLQVGQELHYFAKNTSGATINDGSPVIVTGTVGASGKLEIGPALGDGSVEQRYFIGAATQDIANNEFGYVTSFGLIRGIDTSAWADGTLLYVSDTVAGTWTDTEPDAPSWRQTQAIVVHAHSNGSIFIRATPEHKLGGLQDVYAPTPADGDILKWVSANSRWESGPATGGGLAFNTVEVDLGSALRTGGSFTISGAGMTVGKPVLVTQAVGPYTGKGTRADEAEMDRVTVAASVTAANTITAYWNSASRVKGNFKFDYAIGA